MKVRGVRLIGVELFGLSCLIAGLFCQGSDSRSPLALLRGLSNSMKVYGTLDNCNRYNFPVDGQPGDPCFRCTGTSQANALSTGSGTWLYGVKQKNLSCGDKQKGKIVVTELGGQIVIACGELALTGDKCPDLPAAQKQ